MMLLSGLSLEEIRELHDRSHGSVSYDLSQLCAARGYFLTTMSRDIVNVRSRTFFHLTAMTPMGKLTVSVSSAAGMEEMVIGGTPFHLVNEMFSHRLVDAIAYSVCSSECEGAVILGVMSVMEANRGIIMELIARSVHES